MILDCFDVLIFFLNIYIILMYFQAKKHFEKQPLMPYSFFQLPFFPRSSSNPFE